MPVLNARKWYSHCVSCSFNVVAYSCLVLFSPTVHLSCFSRLLWLINHGGTVFLYTSMEILEIFFVNVFPTCRNVVDCEQSLSFPSVFLAFLRASVELWSSEQRAAKPRDFLSLPIPSSFLSLICIILMSSTCGGFQEQKPTTRSLEMLQLMSLFHHLN